MRLPIAACSALAVCLSTAAPLSARSTNVRALSLPEGFTVVPEAEQKQVVIARDGTIVALAASTDRTYRHRVFRWNAQGERTTFTPNPVSYQPNLPSHPQEIAAGNGIYVTAAVDWSGAYSGTTTEVQQWSGDGTASWTLPGCVYAGDEKDQHAYGADADGRIALTMDIIGQGSYQVLDDTTGKFAPYAFVVRNGACRNLGRGIVEAVRGQWAAGYRGYLDGHVAADNINTVIQDAKAVRWFGDYARELGPGDALAINALGIAVGASAVPGRFVSVETNVYSRDRSSHTYRSDIPHAIAWNANGRAIALAPNAARSVAYDIGDDGTIVGMLVGAGGKHYAFVWRQGTLQRLDDLPHPPGWRFESAYAIGDDGTIAGVGTYNGTATVFAESVQP